uniref:CSON015032 protein n=1 Tax=Culicoides sonorensis TaxID=179676 RepID=A0A336LS52_CULSO
MKFNDDPLIMNDLSFIQMTLLLMNYIFKVLREFCFKYKCALRPVGLFRGCETPKLKNGVVRLRQRGRLVNFSCRSPFILHGDRYASCISGRWDVRPPICIKSGCETIKTPENSIIYAQHSNAVITMFCHSGYQRVGSAQTYCDGESWDRPLGVCREITTEIQKSCDFETDDWCGWTQDAHHDFDWKRTNGVYFGKVLSIGPNHDHTIQRPLEGYYIYLDMKDEDVGTKARLVSPSYSANQSENACFRLFYHMYGLSPGKLRVYAKPLSTEILDAVGNDAYKYFEVSGNQGNMWKEGFFNLPIFEEEFQIIIEGTSTRQYDSHIAIDDVELLNGADCDPANGTKTDDDEKEDSDGIFETLSCENRCSEEKTTLLGNASDIITYANGTRIKKCDCFYGCEELNTCCTNYKGICGSATTPEEEIATEPIVVTKKLTSTSTTLKTTRSTSTTTSTTTTSTTPRTIKTTQKVTTTPRTTKTSTSTSTTTQKPTTASSSSSTTTTKIQTTPVKNDIDDILTIAVTPYNDDYSDEEVAHLLPPGQHHLTTLPDQTTDTHYIFYTILTSFIVFGVLIGAAGAVIQYRRRKYDPRNYKQNNGRNGTQGAGDEFSEIRYLTTDEQLDFTLQTPIQ